MAATMYRTLKTMRSDYNGLLENMISLFQDCVLLKGNRWPTGYKVVNIELVEGHYVITMSEPFPRGYDMSDFDVEYVGPAPPA